MKSYPEEQPVSSPLPLRTFFTFEIFPCFPQNDGAVEAGRHLWKLMTPLLKAGAAGAGYSGPCPAMF